MIDLEFKEEIITNLPKIVENGPSEESTELLRKLGLCPEHIEEVLSLVNDAYARVSLYASGMKPKQFSGDLDNNIIFNEAVKIFQKR
jgi:hypothetical protein